MTKTETLAAVRDSARNAALYLQTRAKNMTGTELYAEEEYIPTFASVIASGNMLDRSAGFICRSSAGRVVRLIQPYDSIIYPGEPETLPAQWGFKWSTDPAKALPFVEHRYTIRRRVGARHRRRRQSRLRPDQPLGRGL